MKSTDQIEKECKELIEKCHWRQNVHGVYICAGAVSPCACEIDGGRCDTLINYFKDLRKEDKENG